MAQIWIGSTDLVHMLRVIGGWHVGCYNEIEASDAVSHARAQGWLQERTHFAPAIPHGVQAYELTDAGLMQLRQWDERAAGGADQMRNWYRANAKKYLTQSAPTPRGKRDGLVEALNKWTAPDFSPPFNTWGPELRRILTESRDELNRYRVWVDDLQSDMYVNCVYCGFRYGPSSTTPVTMADALKAHVALCTEHPMSGLLAACEATLPAIDMEIDLRGDADGQYEYPMTRLAAQMRDAVAKVKP